MEGREEEIKDGRKVIERRVRREGGRRIVVSGKFEQGTIRPPVHISCAVKQLT